MKAIAYYDGKIGRPEDLTIPFNDRSHFFGDGVYDASMGANNKIMFINEHLDRFYSSAASVHIPIPLEKDELNDLLHSLLRKVDGDTQFVYWQVTRGYTGIRNHIYKDIPGKLWVLISEEDLADPNKPLSLITLEDKRYEYCNIKTINLLPAVLYANKGNNNDCDEVVLHRGDIVTECSHSNVSILKDGILFSHPNNEHILRGIAKTHLIQAAFREGIQVIEKPFTLDELIFQSDEVIVTSSSHICMHANIIDGIQVGGKDPLSLKRLCSSVYEEAASYCETTFKF